MLMTSLVSERQRVRELRNEARMAAKWCGLSRPTNIRTTRADVRQVTVTVEVLRTDSTARQKPLERPTVHDSFAGKTGEPCVRECGLRVRELRNGMSIATGRTPGRADIHRRRH